MKPSVERVDALCAEGGNSGQERGVAGRMVYVGSLKETPDRDSGWVRAFARLGWEVIPFSTYSRKPKSLLGKLQRRLNLGSQNRDLQERLLDLIELERPDWVHFRLPVQFSRRTIDQIKATGAVVTEYFNDDAFSKATPLGLHWRFRKALTSYDAHFVFRKHNVETYKRAGAKYVEHCAPTFNPETHVYQPLEHGAPFLCDAAFIGHWENDWRLECLERLHKEGFNLIIKGQNWGYGPRRPFLETYQPITPVFGEDYNRIYAGAASGLCFFSKINNDTWTERALEIIAVGGVLVSERTDEAKAYFEDKREAFFFSSIEELICIVRTLRENPDLRARAQLAGYRRLIRHAATVEFRAQQIEKVAVMLMRRP